jgi:hypothetical protein
MRSRRVKSKGVTLVELVLVSSLIAIAGLGIYKALTSGIDVWLWQKANRSNAQMVMFFERFSSDLRNAMNISDDDFSGDIETISFYIHSPEYITQDNVISTVDEEYRHDSILKIEYVYLPEQRSIHRRAYKYQGKDPVSDINVLHNVLNAGFLYYLPGTKTLELTGRNKWKGVMPNAVASIVTLMDRYGNKKEYKKIINIPGR